MATEAPSVKKIRPVNLNLFTIRFPITAIISILHRVTGFLLFLFVPLIVWAFDASLSSPDSFAAVQAIFKLFIVKFLIWVCLSGLIYHMLAGFRHFVMDCGIAESLQAMRLGAKLILSISILSSLILGIWLW